MTRAEGQLLNRELADAAKNWLAIDGLWFQAIEQEYGMKTALERTTGSGSSSRLSKHGGS